MNKKPLNYAILKHFTNVEEACVIEIMDELKDQYAHFKAFNEKDIMTALMTAEANGLLEESKFNLEGDKLHVYFRASEGGLAMIKRYIQD